MAAEPSQVVEGVVERVNETGVFLLGQWFNRSKFGEPIPLPGVGERVRLEVKGSFIRRVLTTQTSLPDAAPAAAGAPAAPPSGFAAEWARGTNAPSAGAAGSAETRDQQIRRLALVKAAAAYLSGRETATPASVLRVAHYWERWVLGGEPPAAHRETTVAPQEDAR